MWKTDAKFSYFLTICKIRRELGEMSECMHRWISAHAYFRFPTCAAFRNQSAPNVRHGHQILYFVTPLKFLGEIGETSVKLKFYNFWLVHYLTRRYGGLRYGCQKGQRHCPITAPISITLMIVKYNISLQCHLCYEVYVSGHNPVWTIWRYTDVHSRWME